MVVLLLLTLPCLSEVGAEPCTQLGGGGLGRVGFKGFIEKEEEEEEEEEAEGKGEGEWEKNQKPRLCCHG